MSSFHFRSGTKCQIRTYTMPFTMSLLRRESALHHPQFMRNPSGNGIAQTNHESTCRQIDNTVSPPLFVIITTVTRKIKSFSSGTVAGSDPQNYLECTLDVNGQL